MLNFSLNKFFMKKQLVYSEPSISLGHIWVNSQSISKTRKSQLKSYSFCKLSSQNFILTLLPQKYWALKSCRILFYSEKVAEFPLPKVLDKNLMFGWLFPSETLFYFSKVLSEKERKKKTDLNKLLENFFFV